MTDPAVIRDVYLEPHAGELLRAIVCHLSDSAEDPHVILDYAERVAAAYLIRHRRALREQAEENTRVAHGGGVV